ncbi:hypothetical protein CMO91_00365 [Candidatus Woesearchaeota archaeon]|nr:hypothetical protein [Candidatus Woesearchaeota archaeon]
MISVYLFGKPSWELKLTTPIDAQHVMEKGYDLQRRLRKIGIIIARLQASGWSMVENKTYNLYFHKPGMTKQQTVQELRMLCIGRRWVEVVEDAQAHS